MSDAKGTWTSPNGVTVVFATPRKLPKAQALVGRVAVLDVAFASESGGSRGEFEKTTLRLIDELGPRLAAWVDHHDSAHHGRYAADPRFVLATKAQHGACPEMVTPELVARSGPIDTIVCHTDFDGLASAAKWLFGGQEPYPGCDADARAIDTRKGLPGKAAAQLDRAIRARPRDEAVLRAVLDLLASGMRHSSGAIVDAAAAELAPREEEAERLSRSFEKVSGDLALCDVDVAGRSAPFDKTWLLLLGQEIAQMAVVVDGDIATFAAAYDSGVDFVRRFGLSGGMPTMVSVHRAHLATALASLDADPSVVARYDTTKNVLTQ